MNEHESRLARALADEAATRDVDAHALLAETKQRLSRTQPRRPRRVAPVAVAAAVALVVGGVAWTVTRDDGGDRSSEVTGAPEVDREFTCPDRVAVDVSGAQDEFLPRLDGREPADVAREYDAPRWEFVEDGDTARLFLGNEDGTLGSVAEYDREGDGWALREATACGNGSPEAPTADGMRLGRHAGDPHPARDVLDVGGPGVEPVLVDDRQVYDHSGLVLRHRSIYAAPCGARLCLAVGQPDSGVRHEVRLSAAPATTTFSGCSFFVPDDLVGRASPYELVGLWDPSGKVTDVRATSLLSTTIAELALGPAPEAVGGSVDATRFEDPTWGGGRLWLVAMPVREGYRPLITLEELRRELELRTTMTSC